MKAAHARRIMHVLCTGLLIAAVSVSCASGNRLVQTSQGAHIATVSVHAIVTAEQTAFSAGAIDLEHHAVYVDALLKLAETEQVLNDALRVWNASPGTPIPDVVLNAIFSLDVIAADLEPLLPANSAVAPVLDTLRVALVTLKGGR